MDEAQPFAVAGLALFAGATLLLSRIRWFRRRPLGERLAPYVDGAQRILMSADTFAQVIGPLARAVGSGWRARSA